MWAEQQRGKNRVDFQSFFSWGAPTFYALLFMKWLQVSFSRRHVDIRHSDAFFCITILIVYNVTL